MPDALTMDSKYAVNAKLAECYVTMDSQRINFGQAINLEARLEPQIQEVPILGRVNMGHKPSGAVGTGSLTSYFNTALLIRMAHQYQETGVMPMIDIQSTNHDEATGLGRNTVILRDVYFESLLIAAFDAEGEFLQQDMDFTFERFDYPEQFAPLPGQ